MAYIQMPGFNNSLPHNMVHVPNSTDRRVQHLPLNKHVVDSTIIGTRQDRTSENHDLRVLQLVNMGFFCSNGAYQSAHYSPICSIKPSGFSNIINSGSGWTPCVARS